MTDSILDQFLVADRETKLRLADGVFVRRRFVERGIKFCYADAAQFTLQEPTAWFDAEIQINAPFEPGCSLRISSAYGFEDVASVSFSTISEAIATIDAKAPKILERIRESKQRTQDLYQFIDDGRSARLYDEEAKAACDTLDP